MQTLTRIQSDLSQVHNGCLWAERGTGKSYGLALQILENLHLKSIVVTSQSFRATKIIQSLLEQLCQKRGIDYGNVERPANYIRMRIAGCTIMFVLVSSVIHNEGELLLVDEFQLIPHEFLSVIVTHHNWKAVASI